jgi:hypothetical protein
MAQNLYAVKTRDEAIEQFEDFNIPMVVEQFEQDGEIDEIARSEEWNNFVDSLCENEEISDWQRDNWTHPDCCEA